MLQGLTSLIWNAPVLHTQLGLPSPLPYMFPSLRKLELQFLQVAASWLSELGSLQSLEALRLVFDSLTDDATTAAAAVRFPLLPSLSHLVVEVWAGLPELLLQLDDLPALTELELCGADSRVAVGASQPAPQLQRLDCPLEEVSADLAALQGLTYAFFSATGRLEDAASIACATSLAYLELWGFGSWSQSALEVLQNLPPSVSCLAIGRTWPQAVVDLVGNMTSIVALQLTYDERPAHAAPHAAPLPAEGAPLWAHLRALRCDRLCHQDGERDLPEVGTKRTSAACLTCC